METLIVEEILSFPTLNTDPASDKFRGRAKVLKELVEHHAGDEEKDRFPRAKKIMSKETLATLGEQLEARKKQLLSAA